MILEVVILNIIPGQEKEFEATLVQASPIIAGMNGYRWHQLQHCVEVENRYLLLVQWQTLEDHTVGFRGSEQYQEWGKTGGANQINHNHLQFLPGSIGQLLPGGL